MGMKCFATSWVCALFLAVPENGRAGGLAGLGPSVHALLLAELNHPPCCFELKDRLTSDVLTNWFSPLLNACPMPVHVSASSKAFVHL